MFDALWTLRLRWRLWLGTTGLLLVTVAVPIWWQTAPPAYQAEAVIVVEATSKGVLLGRLNSGVVARATGLRAGESVLAVGRENSELVRVIGTATAAMRAVAIANDVIETLLNELRTDAARRQGMVDVGVAGRRQRLEQEHRAVEAALRKLPAPNGLPVPAGGTLVVVGDAHPKDVFRVALESRYLELTKTLAALAPPASGAGPGITVLDPAVAATALPVPWAPLRSAVVVSLVLGLVFPLGREWWMRELAQRRGGES